MKDISIYFKPAEVTVSKKEGTIGAYCEVHTETFFPSLDEKGVAFISVPEYRNSDIECDEVSDAFREELYQLHRGDNWSGKLYDLGIINPGNKVEDTYFAVGQTISELMKQQIIPIVIGGGQDLTLACYKGFEAMEQMINICAIDSKLDIGEPNEAVHADGFVSHLLMQRPCYLFNYANIGMQRPLVPKNEVELFDKLYFDICRLGAYNSNFKLAEPYMRNSDMLSLDFESIKCTETDPQIYSNVNGFYAEQICQLMKYAGSSDKMSCIGIFNVAPVHNRSAQALLAQSIWYFLDGVAQRVGDFPIGSKKNYTKFVVHLDDFEDDLTFYRSNKSDRWWLEVKYLSKGDNKYERHTMVPCDHDDYEKAMKNGIPNLWWKTLQKLS